MCEQCNKLRAELSELRQAVGLATTAVPDMVMDADHPIEMMHKVVAENRRLQERVERLESTLEWIVQDYNDFSHDDTVEAARRALQHKEGE